MSLTIQYNPTCLNLFVFNLRHPTWLVAASTHFLKTANSHQISSTLIYICIYILTQTPKATRNGAKFDRNIFRRKTSMTYVGLLKSIKTFAAINFFLPVTVH